VTSSIRTRAAGAVSPSRISDDPAIVASFLSDAAHVSGGFTDGVIFPDSVDAVAAAVAAAHHLLPVGAQSSLTGGATPRGELVLSTRRLMALDICDRRHVRVGPGVTLATLQQQLAQRGLYYPPAPTYDGASVGGTIATNAAGAATFKYGSTRPWVHAITVVLADGGILDITRGSVTASSRQTVELVRADDTSYEVPLPHYAMPRVAKLSAGYFSARGMDLIDLFIGSEGTLGVVSEAVLRIVDLPVRLTALVTCSDDPQALAVTAALREHAREAWAGRGALDISAVEYMDARSLRIVPDAVFHKSGIARPAPGAVLLLVQMEVTQSEEATLGAFGDVLETAGVAVDPAIARAGDARGAQRMFDVREAVPASVNAAVARAREHDDRIEKTAGDLIVPFESLGAAIVLYREVLDAQDLDYAIWGHVSDGNLHVNIVPRSMADVVAGRDALVDLARRVITMGGSPLAEHGVGRSAMKQLLLRELYGEDGIEQMRRIKRALDPTWKLSPGVVFPAAG